MALHNDIFGALYYGAEPLDRVNLRAKNPDLPVAKEKPLQYGPELDIDQWVDLLAKYLPAVDPKDPSTRNYIGQILADASNQDPATGAYAPRTLKNRTNICAYGFIRRGEKRGTYRLGALERDPSELDFGDYGAAGDADAWSSYRPQGYRPRRRIVDDEDDERRPEVIASKPRKHFAQEGVCPGCGRPTGHIKHTAIAHVKARSKDPEKNDVVSNAVVMHHYCNWAMRTGTIAQLRERLIREGVMDERDIPAADKALRRGLAQE